MARRRRRSRRPVNRVIVIAIAIVAVYFWLNYHSRSGNGEAPVALLEAGDPTYARSLNDTWPEFESDPADTVAADFGTANYYVILDGSGSMEEQRCSGNASKMEAAKEALLTFAGQFPRAANLGLAAFDGSGLSERLPLGPLDMGRLSGEVGAIQAEGGTPLMNALALGYQALTAQGRRQLGYGEYHLVVVTDGEANEGQDPSPVVEHILTRSPVVIHTIGFCIGERHSLNQAGFIDYRAADDPAALSASLTAVLAESPVFDVTDF